MIYKTALPFLALISAAACVDAAPAPKAALSAVVIPTKPAGTIDGFGANLHGVIRSQRGNFVYSPASIAMALSMTREGARGETANAMDRVLEPGVVKQSKVLLQKLSTQPQPQPQQQGAPMPSEIHIANRIFADGRTVFEPAFMKVTTADWLAPAETLDFRKDPDAGRVRINGWVSHETHDKISNLLAPGTIDQDTRMVLVNAVYMKAQWLSPFTASETKPGPFWTSASASKQTPLMHGVVSGSAGEHANATVVSMPYSFGNGPQLSMLVVVPKAKDGLQSVEDAYIREGADPFAKAMNEHGKIDLTFPKFKVTGSFELSDALSKMGMERAFSDDADFSGMSTKTPLKISKVIHQAFAEVDEKGTEAAAATAVVMAEITSVSVPRKPLVVTVDRPFLFFVRDDASGAVLFAGRITDPSA